MIGEKLGRLLVLEKAEPQSGLKRYLCRCDCGNERVILAKNLRRTTYPTRSCGCLKADKARERMQKLKIYNPSDNIPWPASKEILT